jgi:transposase-like protein
MAYRKYSLSEKQRIISESLEIGVTEAARKNNVASSLIYKWQSAATEGKLRETGQDFNVNPLQAEMNKLLLELASYKEMVAERDLEIRVKDALIKKVQQREQTK